MKLEYKISSHNSTVCGYPGRDFDWSKFDWKGLTIHGGIFKGDKDLQAPKPFVDSCLIARNCQYLHVPYDFVDNGTIYRVRPNRSMYAGKTYRGHLITKQTAIEKNDGWYWVLETIKTGRDTPQTIPSCCGLPEKDCKCSEEKIDC